MNLTTLIKEGLSQKQTTNSFAYIFSMLPTSLLEFNTYGVTNNAFRSVLKSIKVGQRTAFGELLDITRRLCAHGSDVVSYGYSAINKSVYNTMVEELDKQDRQARAYSKYLEKEG